MGCMTSVLQQLLLIATVKREFEKVANCFVADALDFFAFECAASNGGQAVTPSLHDANA